MKRQERLLLFFEREADTLNAVLAEHTGYAGLYFSSHAFPNLKATGLKFLFKAANHKTPDADVVFDAQELPLPADFFDVVVLDHILDFADSASSLDNLFKETVRILRKQGSVIITGFNKSRLCSWPLQNTFGRSISCRIRRYSAVHVLSLLDQFGFATEVKYYDFCRSGFWNKIFKKVMPFLGIGFVIIARRQSLNLLPLEELDWNFAAAETAAAPVQQPGCLDRRVRKGREE